MLLRTLQNSPAKTVTVAMALVVVGLSLLVLGITWPYYIHTFTHLRSGTEDFFHGLLFGLAIALEIGGVALAATAAVARMKN